MLQTILGYAWMIIPFLAIIGYKFTLRVFFGMVIIPENKIGLITNSLIIT